jgi:4'-phosphopantetheinyl transferase
MAILESTWLAPPADLSLPDDAVHIWRVSLAQANTQVQELAHTLSPAERERAQRFCFERDRRRYIVARGALRSILGGYLSIHPSHLKFRYGIRGKPYLARSCDDGTMQFNLSHSNEMALYAYTRSRRIGIDLEYIHPVPDANRVADQFFSRGEKAALRALPRDQIDEAFLTFWTRKEAYVKALGEGLYQPLDQFDVSSVPGKPYHLLEVPNSSGESSQWSVATLNPAPGYLASLAAEGYIWNVKCFSFPTEAT